MDCRPIEAVEYSKETSELVVTTGWRHTIHQRRRDDLQVSHPDAHRAIS